MLPRISVYTARSQAPALSLAQQGLHLQEAMRLRPVASTGTTRRTERELSLLGYKIPAGTLMLCPFDPAHRWEGNWPDRPEEFVPVCRPLQGPMHMSCLPACTLPPPVMLCQDAS